MTIERQPRESATGKPIPDTHVGCHEIQRMFKMSWCQVNHLLKKYSVPFLKCTRRYRWVDREQFLDAYEAKGKPDPATVGLVKLDDVAESLGLDPSNANRLCRRLGIKRVRANTTGNPSYISPADVERMRANTRATKSKHKPVPMPASQSAKEVSPTERAKLDKAIAEHYADVQANIKASNERTIERLRLSAMPPTPAEKLAMWKAEYKAARKRASVPAPSVPKVTPGASRRGKHENRGSHQWLFQQ